MQHLFSSFDSNSSLKFYLNWLEILIPLMFISSFWMNSNQLKSTIKTINKFLNLEIKTIFKSKMSSSTFLIFNSLFMSILFMNLFGLLPYIFTASSHLSISLFMSLSIWLGNQMYSWFYKTNFMWTHLVPTNTPNLLIPFLVMIESLSNIIRPFTLAIRLSANMTAGHLLLCLLGSSFSVNNPSILIIIILAIIMLLMLEFAVAMIQAYVFTLLSCLYTEETSH